MLEETGDLEIEEFYQESLLAATDIMPGVAQGRADLGYMVSLYHPGELPLSQVVGIPFKTSDAEAQAKTLNALYAENESFRAEYDQQGVHVLSFVPVASSIVGTKEPLNGLDDLKGKKIRAIGLLSQALQSAGASPVALPAPEVYESVERGIIDGFASYPLDVAVANSLHEVAPYMTDPGSGLYLAAAVIMNKDLWDGLSEAERAVVTDPIEDYVDNAVELLAEEEQKTCDILKESGGQATVFSEEDVERFAELSADAAVASWREQVAQAGVSEDVANDFFEQYEAVLAEEEASSSYTSGVAACAGAGS